ncbi:hypothetical protein NG726_02725 [Pseudomonas sp. MOB-449]|nr:hypothetical protein [Pseudomonas sp. MOB-449]
MLFKNVLNAVDHHAAIELGSWLIPQQIRGFTPVDFNRSMSRGLAVQAHRSVAFVSLGGLNQRTEILGNPVSLAGPPARSGAGQAVALTQDKNLKGAGLNGVKEESATKGSTSAVIPNRAGPVRSAGLSRLGLDPYVPFPEGYALSVTWQKALG